MVKNRNLYSIIVLLLIMISVSPLLNATLIISTSALIILSSMYWQIRIKRKLVLNFDIIFIVTVFAITGLIDGFNVDDNSAYSILNFAYPAFFLGGYFIAKILDTKDFFYAFEKVVFCLALLSLVGMSIYFINDSLVYSFPTYSFNNKTHHTILFFNYLFEDGWMIVRNSGMAWEPGVFQLLLNIGLHLHLKENKENIFKTLIYITSIFFTKSTMGFLILFLNIYKIFKVNKLTIALVAGVSVLYLPILYETYIYQMEYKLLGSSAFNYRLDPMMNALDYLAYPFGIGNTKYNYLLNFINIGSFDSYTQIFLRYGYTVLFYVIYKIYKIYTSFDKSLAIFLFLGYLSEPLWGFILFTTIYYLNYNIKGVDDGSNKIIRV